MKNKKKSPLLILTDDLKYACGVTTHLYNLLLGLIEKNEFEIHLISSGGDSIERFQNLNIRLIEKGCFKYQFKSIFNFLHSILYLTNYVRKHKIELIHSQNHYVANIAFIVSKFLKITTIQSHHNLFTTYGRLSLFKASQHIVVSKRIKDYFLANNIADEKDVFLIRYGIKSENISIEKNMDKITILALSRLIPEKGLDTYIKAVALLPREYFNKVEFYLAGEGIEEKKLTKLISSTGTPIKFLGEIKDSLNTLGKNHIFVITSYWKNEGYPLTIIEAALTNNFIITSDFEGVEEVFENEKDGFVFKNSNPEDLAEKIKYAIDNYHNLTNVIDNCYSKIKKVFNYDKMVENISSIYRGHLN